MRSTNILIAMVIIAVTMMGYGCASGKVDKLVAASNIQAQRQGITEAVLQKLAERDRTVVGDTLAHMEPGGAAAYLEIKRAIRDSDLKPITDKDGKIQFEEIIAVAKSRSGREFANLVKGNLTMIGLPRGKDGTIDINAMPDVMRVELEETLTGGSSTVNADWAKVWGDSINAEKATIVQGVRDIAEARGAAWAVKFKAAADGTTQVITGLGTLAGQIVKTTVVPVGTDLAEQGVTKLVQAFVKSDDGTSTKVIAVDTPTSTAATECEGCSEK